MSRRMHAVVEGDAEALLWLYDHTHSNVLHTARRILGPGLDAEEVVVETFEQVWSRRAQFDPRRGTALHWLLTIVRSRAVDCRRELAGRRLHEESAGRRRAACCGEPGEELELTERRTRLDEALASLTPVQRRYLRSSFLLGETHQEIARREGAPLGTVKSTIRRGLQALRSSFGDLEDTLR